MGEQEEGYGSSEKTESVKGRAFASSLPQWAIPAVSPS